MEQLPLTELVATCMASTKHVESWVVPVTKHVRLYM